MQALSLEGYGIETLSFEDLLTIDGGHQGTAYAVGHAVGEGVAAVKEVAECIVAVAAVIALCSL